MLKLRRVEHDEDHPGKGTTFFPEALRKAELKDAEDNAKHVGVALSGGGIRSATISLGFFQGLARHGLIPRIDYLSTVSGGGYFGSFLGHLYARDDLAPEGEKKKGSTADDQSGSKPRPTVVQDILKDSGSPQINNLRENGRYLAPNGSGDLLLAGAVVLRNWASALLVMLVFALLLMSTICMLRFSLEAMVHNWLPAPWSWGSLWLSSWFIAAVAVFVVFAVPPAWAYWLVGEGDQQWKDSKGMVRWAAPVACLLAGLWWGWHRGVDSETLRNALRLLTVLASLTVARYAVAHLSAKRNKKGDPGIRRRLSTALTRALVAVVVIVCVGVVDTLGQSLVLLEEDVRTGVVSGYAILSALAIGGRRLIVTVAARFKVNERPTVNVNILIYAAALLLVVGILGAVAAIPHMLVLGLSPTPATITDVDFDPISPLPLLLLASLVLTVLMGHVWSFVNRSSLNALYEARLRRAYMGASNPARVGDCNNLAVTEPHEGDELDFERYRPEKNGGPIHLINVTINETVGGRSQVQRQDRKGMGMAIGPGGVSVSRRHHAIWEHEDTQFSWRNLPAKARSYAASLFKSTSVNRESAKAFQVFADECTPEKLSVGQWIAISGAAFSTGLGSRTNLGLSLLAGLFNVRLGYWWSSDVNPDKRACRTPRTGPRAIGAILKKVLPVQTALLDEWCARFPGVERDDWYLSDGGHFENMGAYELIRRRLPFIVVCDNEMDKDYKFPGLANLVRLARVDFDTEIKFLTCSETRDLVQDDELSRWIGTLDALKRGVRQKEPVDDPVTGTHRIDIAADLNGLSLARAAIARVIYPDRPHGWILYVKPTLVGDEPVDVQHYHAEHPDFPHESTADQFFDDAQWESYRKLGEHMAWKLFIPTKPGEWSPRSLMNHDEAAG